MERFVIWGMIIVVSLIGAVANILFKAGVDRFGVIPPQRFLDVSFSIRYLFSPLIFAALVVLFLGRFLIGSPLSVLGVTETFMVITVLNLIFTLILEVLVFNQKYDLWTYVGIIVGLISIALIARETASP